MSRPIEMPRESTMVPRTIFELKWWNPMVKSPLGTPSEKSNLTCLVSSSLEPSVSEIILRISSSSSFLAVPMCFTSFMVARPSTLCLFTILTRLPPRFVAVVAEATVVEPQLVADIVYEPHTESPTIGRAEAASAMPDASNAFLYAPRFSSNSRQE